MRERETAVDFRFVRVLRPEEIVELFLRINLARVLVAELRGAI